MSVFTLLLGLVILVAVTFDVLITTLTVGGGGPLTSRISTKVWQLALKINNQNFRHRILASIGWMLLAKIVVIWNLLTLTGWSLVFCSFNNAIINTTDKMPASILERIYFTAYTLTTLGRGDYRPDGIIWNVFTALAAANGFFLVTLSIAYLFPVVSAATQKRAFAVYIASLGGTGDEILTRAWNGKDFGQLDQHLIAIAPMVAKLGEQHLTYPILHYFHSRERSRSTALSLVALDEALTLLRYGIADYCQFDPAALDTARRSVAAFNNTLKSAYVKPTVDEPPLPSLDLLRAAGIPTFSDAEFLRSIKYVNKRRRFLLALIRNDGWTWEAIASSKTTNRAKNLDDEKSYQ
ncbi:ion channel [Myxosarcina sp. GI1]|uniref:ion channel n=1 Tax=Myxosarcina sp. GI1 TaxID=1541065 RepID=UPI000560DD84|nr:ion channel [Myxosarcina sp. GI1]